MKEWKGHSDFMHPAKFGDPLALSTQWEPLQPGGTNFKTYRIVKPAPGCLEFHATKSTLIFTWTFAVIGLVVGLIGASFLWSTLTTSSGEDDRELVLLFEIIALVVGLLFFGVGWYGVRKAKQKIIFNKNINHFWHQPPNQPKVVPAPDPPHYTAFSDIHAIQLISERLRGSERSFYSYELNLVLKDGQRVPVIDHGDLKAIVAQADEVGKFVGVPVWNMVD